MDANRGTYARKQMTLRGARSMLEQKKQGSPMLKEVFMVLTQALVQTSLIQHLDITMTLPGTRSPCL